MSDVTQAGLLSGSSSKDRSEDATGGLLREIGDRGVIAFKDFTTILSMSREKLNALLSMLREVYDGQVNRLLGTDGGANYEWEGMVTVVAGVTEAIDRHHAVMSELGPRFLFYRMDQVDPLEITRRATRSRVTPETSLPMLRDAVDVFLKQVAGRELPSFDDETDEWVRKVAALVARGRSGVERDGYKRELICAHTPEVPSRIAAALTDLMKGLLLIGVREDEARRITRKVGLDSIPPARRHPFEALAIAGRPLTTTLLREGSRFSASATWRALEELEIHGLVKRARPGNENEWSLTDEAAELVASIGKIRLRIPARISRPNLASVPTGAIVVAGSSTGGD